MLFRASRKANDAIVLGDFDMNATPYGDVWPMLRSGGHGYTEDTAINHMRFDNKNKHRHGRFWGLGGPSRAGHEG